MNKLNLVVIGNGMVGHHFLEQLAASPKAHAFQVTVIGEENYCAYDRVHLSEYFQGKSSDELALGSAKQYKDWGFKLHLGGKSHRHRAVFTQSTARRWYRAQL